MILVRRKYELEQLEYYQDLYKRYGQIPQNDTRAITMRMEYFREYVLRRNSYDYKTNVEKDWAYNALKEYKSDVNVRAAADGFAAGMVSMMIRVGLIDRQMFMLKKFVFWPFIPVCATVFWYRQNELFIFFHKKYFDMMNLGQQYEIGYARNRVLEKCNELLDRQDF